MEASAKQQMEATTAFDLTTDHSLKGFLAEQTAKVFLRRLRRNNFVFVVNQFTDLSEIIQKYRFQMPAAMHLMLGERIHADIIEFVLADVVQRQVMRVHLYEVKSESEPFSITPTTHAYLVGQSDVGMVCGVVHVAIAGTRIVCSLREFGNCKFRIRSRFCSSAA